MKKILLILMALCVAGSFAIAQMPPDSKPDMELMKDEATLRIQAWQQKVADLEAKLKTLDTQTDDIKKQIELAKANLKECQDEVKRLLGINDADIEAFRQKLGVIEGKIRELKRLSDDQLADRQDEVKELEAQLNALRMEKAALIPEFYNKIIELAREIKGLYREKKITTYTVGTWAENRDCLWNIAGKIEIFGDPFLWPKIWQYNTEIIRNPDIIHPGQVLKLPIKGPKTSEEMKAERRYWRMKRAAAEAAAQTQATPETKTGEAGKKGE